MTCDVVLYFVISKMFLGGGKTPWPWTPRGPIRQPASTVFKAPHAVPVGPLRMQADGQVLGVRGCWAAAGARGKRGRRPEGAKDSGRPEAALYSKGGAARSVARAASLRGSLQHCIQGGVPGRPPLSFLMILGLRKNSSREGVEETRDVSKYKRAPRMAVKASKVLHTIPSRFRHGKHPPGGRRPAPPNPPGDLRYLPEASPTPRGVRKLT